MIKFKHEVKLAIQHIDGNVIGFFQERNFDPLTVFADLICEADKEQKALDIFEENFGAVWYQIDCDYFEVICDLKRRLINNSIFTLVELEKLKAFYQLTFTLDISIMEPANPEDNTPILIPLRFGFCGVDKVFETPDVEHHYIYHCFSMLDVIFAVLHYLLWNGYKFKRCEHCQKYFATKSFKQKYCKRKSTYKGYEHLECKEAVDHIMKFLKQRKKAIYENLYQYHPNTLNEFLETWERLGGKTVEKSVAALEELDRLTDKPYRNSYWYHK